MSEVMTHLFKITLVAFFSIYTGVDMVYPMFIGVQKALMEVVTTSAMVQSGNCTTNGTSGEVYTVIWQRVDCLVGDVMGSSLSFSGSVDGAVDPFTSGSPAPYSFGAAMLGLFSSSVGGLVFILATVTIFATIIGFASAVVHYIMCLVAIVILSTIAPLVIPAVLFSSTKGFFDVWFRAFLAYTVQPAILFAYLAFMTHAIGIIIHGSGGGGEFGLFNSLEKAKVILDDENAIHSRNLFEGRSENLDSHGVTSGPITGAGEDETAFSYLIPSIEMEDNDKAALLVNLIAVTMIVAMLNAFMFNVMAFGAQLAGIPATFSMGNITNAFSQAMFLFKGGGSK
jgi:hypothetical protein